MSCECWYTMEPELRERHCGGWLAVSPRGAGMRIGATGETAKEAHAGFIKARDRARELFEAEAERQESHPAQVGEP